MPQMKLDESLLGKKKEQQNTSNGVTVTPNHSEVVPEGLTVLYVDVHEPLEIVEMLRKEKGIYVIVKALDVGDYCFSNVGIERKTIRDFYNSIVHGDKRIWRQMFDLKRAFERPMLIIEWDESFISSPGVERTIRGALASIFLMGISVLTIPSTTKSVRPFVDQLAYIFFSSDKKALSMRPVPEKAKRRVKKEIISDVLCMIPEIGRRQADLIAQQVNSIEEICKMSDEELKKKCATLGPQRLDMLRWILNGKEIETPKDKGSKNG